MAKHRHIEEKWSNLKSGVPRTTAGYAQTISNQATIAKYVHV